VVIICHFAFAVKSLHSLLIALCAFLLPARSAPNVIVIFVDDLGWPDGGAAWSQHLSSLGVPATADLLTPNLDSLVQNGVRFTNGYVSAPICSPSRAGLMTGRYQQRFGYEMNPGPLLEYDPVFGLPLTECTLGDRMKSLGYATAWIGKSHLGARPPLHPVRRGFDEFYGFLEGHHHYCLDGSCDYPWAQPPWVQLPPNRADWDPIHSATAPLSEANPPILVEEQRYLTAAFGEEAVNYIGRHRLAHPAQPFFIYAPFNAVHEPVEVTQQQIDDTKHLFPPYDTPPFDQPPTPLNARPRHKLAAMMKGLDDAVGAILTKLRSYPLPPLTPGGPPRTLEDETVIFYSSDNGAPPATRGDKNGSVSLPLRGNKSDLYEGGIRVPWVMQWKDEFAARTVHEPVSTLDILPTCVAAAGATVPAAWQLDGVNLLPFLRGHAPEPHPVMFWRLESGRAEDVAAGPRAMRQGKWKFVKPSWSSNWELYDLTTPNGLRETENVADAHPEKLRELIPLYETWEATLMRPLWDFNDPDYVTPTTVLQDVRIGPTESAVLGPEFLPGADHSPGHTRVAWQDETGRLWNGSVDLSTGFPAGTPLEVDTGLAAVSQYNEGPQWGVYAGGVGLFYTKPGANSQLQIWRDSTALTTHLILDNFGPRVSQEPTAPAVGMIFNRGTATASTAMIASDVAPASVVSLPDQAAVPRNGRWISGTSDIVYVRSGTPTQLARYNTTAGTSVTLTNDPLGALPGDKSDAWAFYAPEFGHELCYACLVDHTVLAVYRYQGAANGIFDRVATLTIPPWEAARFLHHMKPLAGARGFNGVSWFSVAAFQNSDAANPGASAIWLLGLGTDPAHRHPQPPQYDAQNNLIPIPLCNERPSFARRVSDPAATGTASWPETVIGEREVLCYYTRTLAAGPAQLRLARTGLTKPDAAPTGFGSLNYSSDFTIGTLDGTQRMSGTETTALVAHEGKLFAAMSSRGNVTANASWTGVQLLIKDSPGADWRLDHSGNLTTLFAGHLACEVLTELTFTRPDPARLLVNSLSDVGATGQTIASARTRLGPGQWVHSTIVDTQDEPAHGLCFAVHLDRDANNDGTIDAGVERVHAGLSNGEIYRGIYLPGNPERLVWGATPDLADTTIELGPVTGLAVANAQLYAACGLRQDTTADALTGGIYVRDDRTDLWSRIYLPPTPQPFATAAESARRINSLTAVPDPRGCAHDVLLFARSWPGVIERLDPAIFNGTATPDGRDNSVTVELDVRDYFARLWNDDSVRSSSATIGYTPFTPAVDPVTGAPVHLLGVWIGASGTHFLIRHRDGTYESASIAGVNLRGTRCFAVSPFAGDAALYLGGYDTGGQPAEDTAWIKRGDWSSWPELSFTSEAQSLLLTWPYTSLDWRLESSPNLTSWSPHPEKPARSIDGTSLQVEPSGREFFRLRRP
jgi:arylsulfatase A-like enzyme